MRRLFGLQRATAIWAVAIALLSCRLAWSVEGIILDPADGLSDAPWDELWHERPGTADSIVLWTTPQPYSDFSIDYRFRAMFSSNTSYEFGTPTDYTPSWAPLSKLSFPLNSFWHGLQFRVERPTWNLHCEWMMPQQGIQEDMKDYDWQIPRWTYTDLGFTQVKWIEGQRVDVGFDFLLTDSISTLPVEIWPMFGYRWQRFNQMAYDLEQVKWDDEWVLPPYSMEGDVINFKQEYSIGYLGGQLRTKLECVALPPTLLTFQGDWGYTTASNRDHHLLRSGDRYTFENTWGGAWHVSLTAETLLSKRFSLGCQIDHMDISTRGNHRWVNVPEQIDQTWSNGVSVKSHQTSVMAFARLRI